MMLAACPHLAAACLSVEKRDLAVRNRDGLARRMAPAQVAEASKLAREWKPKSNRSDEVSFIHLGLSPCRSCRNSDLAEVGKSKN